MVDLAPKTYDLNRLISFKISVLEDLYCFGIVRGFVLSSLARSIRSGAFLAHFKKPVYIVYLGN